MIWNWRQGTILRVKVGESTEKVGESSESTNSKILNLHASFKVKSEIFILVLLEKAVGERGDTRLVFHVACM